MKEGPPQRTDETIDQEKNAVQHLVRPTADPERREQLVRTLENMVVELQIENERLEREVSELKTEKAQEAERTESLKRKTQELEELIKDPRRDPELRELIDYDPLMHILNRRGFIHEAERLIAHEEARLEELREHGRREEDEEGEAFLSFLIIDLDHFKKINDTYGHGIGDDVLRAVGQVLKDHIRGKDDYVGRWGGEEMVVALKTYASDVDYAITERLRNAIKNIEVHGTDEGEKVSVSASIGLTRWQEGDDLHGVLAFADTAVYAAKNEGRDQVVTIHREDGKQRIISKKGERLLSPGSATGSPAK
jgi:diguanylate cyclase (GGDEF)-like protein